MFDFEAVRSASSPTLPSPASIVPETVASPEPAPIVQMTPLPDYSPHLPQIDRTKQGEDFFADLQNKRIIPGYDDERFSCWCHVAKSAEDPQADVLSNTHTDLAAKDTRGRRYETYRWFGHVSRCKFYKVSVK